jgi:hypothetical protein
MKKGDTMKKRKIKVEESVILRLKEMRDLLEEIPLDEIDLDQPKGGDGCGALCMITCSFYCRDNCNDTCRTNCENTCRGTLHLETCMFWKYSPFPI